MNPVCFSRACLICVAVLNTYILSIIYDVVENNNEILNEINENKLK